MWKTQGKEKRKYFSIISWLKRQEMVTWFRLCMLVQEVVMRWWGFCRYDFSTQSVFFLWFDDPVLTSNYHIKGKIQGNTMIVMDSFELPVKGKSSPSLRKNALPTNAKTCLVLFIPYLFIACVVRYWNTSQRWCPRVWIYGKLYWNERTGS